jgi:large subunit ribosomal protein L14
MILRQTWVSIADSTTVVWLQAFHLYKGFRRSMSPTGSFIKGAAKVVTPPRVEYKGFKFKYNIKGDICRGIIVRTTYRCTRLDGGSLKFHKNSSVLIKKKQNIKSKYLVGPVSKLLKRRKFKAAFKQLI